jgi:thiol-disulfide isomerase/thioredoxin
MYKILLLCLTALLIVGLAAGCGVSNTENTQAQTTEPAAKAEPAQTAEPDRTSEPTEPEAAPYDFEWTDIDGNVHRMSDYKGKPVYLRIWGSWCGVCVQSLPSLDALSAEAEDFYVLTVVPKVMGEKSREDFTAWFKELGHDNIMVMYDEKAQVMNDFGVSAFPTQIMFDANGVAIYGAVGEMDKTLLFDTMKKIADGTAG